MNYESGFVYRSNRLCNTMIFVPSLVILAFAYNKF